MTVTFFFPNTDQFFTIKQHQSQLKVLFLAGVEDICCNPKITIKVLNEKYDQIQKDIKSSELFQYQDKFVLIKIIKEQLSVIVERRGM